MQQQAEAAASTTSQKSVQMHPCSRARASTRLSDKVEEPEGILGKSVILQYLPLPGVLLLLLLGNGRGNYWQLLQNPSLYPLEP